MIKPYQQITIAESGEPLVAIPRDQLAFVQPHAYEKLGAPYGGKSPFYLRQTVCDRLLIAQTKLQDIHPGWQIQIFDAYRPIAVQQFMVDHTFLELVQVNNLIPAQLTTQQHQDFLTQVYEFWAVPNLDPAMPPPHSTGGAIDVTLVTNSGEIVDMGSAIDELSPRSYPNFFADSKDAKAQQAYQQRQLLNQVMITAGFQRHPNEWWHFCYGDQMWAWLTNQTSESSELAIYGRVD
jgi:D-alanyl-D-alanine dipeptidase